MRVATVFMHGVLAGTLEEQERGRQYRFCYSTDYEGPAISLNMPTEERDYEFDRFPPFFDGLLPEGMMLEGLLRQRKIDADDLFSQLIAVGADLVGAVTVSEAE